METGGNTFRNKRPYSLDKNGRYVPNFTEDSIFQKSIKDTICNENEVTNDISTDIFYKTKSRNNFVF